MMYVLQVVRQNGTQMLVTILFAFMVVYVFAVWSFSVSYFRNQYAIIDQKATFGIGEDGHPHLGPDQGYETNLALFTLFNWDYGFREGPVWDFAFAQDANNTEVDYGQVLHGFVFNILHYVVVLLVFTAIVSGIIIDSFAELRAAREATRLDILHTCFVCAIEREDFETLGLDFKEHVAAQHNMWDYLFFRLYLEAKDPADFTGLETYCWEQQQKQDIHWFPIKKAVIIEGRNKETKDITGLYRRLDGMEVTLTLTLNLTLTTPCDGALNPNPHPHPNPGARRRADARGAQDAAGRRRAGGRAQAAARGRQPHARRHRRDQGDAQATRRPGCRQGRGGLTCAPSVERGLPVLYSTRLR